MNDNSVVRPGELLVISGRSVCLVVSSTTFEQNPRIFDKLVTLRSDKGRTTFVQHRANITLRLCP